MNSKVWVRYMENSIATAVSFYTEYLGFKEEPGGHAEPRHSFPRKSGAGLEHKLRTRRSGQANVRWPQSRARRVEPDHHQRR